MKKLLIILIILIPLVSFGQEIKYVNGNNLNVRNGAGLNFEVITQFEKGQKVEVIATTKNGDWSHIITDDEIEGYVFSRYLSSKNTIEFSSSQNQDITEDVHNDINNSKESDFNSGQIFIIILVIAFFLKLLFGGKSNSKSKSSKEKNKKIVWHHCLKCNILIKTSDRPNSHAFACQKKTRHNWVELGELGNQNYQCQNCSILIQTKNKPTEHFMACQGKRRHYWTKC